MVLYLCPGCNYSTEKKTDFRKHLNKIKKCNENINVSKYQSLLLNEDGCISDIIKKLEEKDKKLDEKDKKIEELEKLLVTITNSHNIDFEGDNNHLELPITNNITNNITVNNYYDPNIEHITVEVFKRIINEDFGGICSKLFKEIWLNPDHPENHNIFLRNISTKTVEVLEDDKKKSMPFNILFNQEIARVIEDVTLLKMGELDDKLFERVDKKFNENKKRIWKRGKSEIICDLDNAREKKE